MKNMMEKLRQWVSASSIRFVSKPYLPSGLIVAVMLLAYTDLIVILLGQSAAYWIDRSRATSSLPILKDLLSAGIPAYAMAGLAYLFLLWALLTIFTRSLALAVWLPVSFLHLSHTIFWVVEKCGLFNASTWKQALPASVNALSALILGILLVRILLRPQTTASSPTGWKSRIKPITLILWAVVLLSTVVVSAFIPRKGWVLLQPEHSPGRRGNSAVAYDQVRQKVVLFGGRSEWIGNNFFYENDTWLWDGSDWVEMHPQNVPLARANHMMAFDEKRGVVVLFGGEDKSGEYMLSDTWEWDGSNWTQVVSENYPQGRSGGQLFYDPETEKIILAGGYYLSYSDKVVTLIDDVWEWDGKDWNYLTYLPKSIMMTNSSVAYDPLQEQTVLFNYDKMMNWEDGEWKDIQVKENLLARYGARLVADPINGQMLVFGGLNNGIQLNDTWLLKGDSWMELHPDLMPSPRDAYMMFYDPVRKSFILYGGISNYALDDMWEFVTP